MTKFRVTVYLLAGVAGNRGSFRPEGGGRGKAKVNERGRVPIGPTGRRYDRESDSEEEELAYAEMEAAIPSFNLMNASLRATYNGRPVLVSEPVATEPPEVLVKSGASMTFSSTSIRASPARRKGIQEDREKHVGECSMQAMGSSNKVGEEEEKERPAFAPPIVIAEAVRAAAILSGRRPLKGLNVDQESREACINGERGPSSRGSPPAQSSGRPPPPLKSWSQFQGSGVHQENGGRSQLPVVSNKLQEDIIRDRESVGAGSRESKLLRKRERETDKSKPRNKKGKWTQEKGDVDGLESGHKGKGFSSAAAVPRNVSFRDIGGIQGTLGMIREIIAYPLSHPEVYEWLGVQPPRGVLLHGPPGCGKTMLANAIAVETGVPFLKISAPEVVSGMSGVGQTNQSYCCLVNQ